MSFLLVAGMVLPARAQQQPDPALLAAILKIKAIDNHTHVPKLVAAGEQPDDEYDALPCAPLEPTADPVMIRGDNPAFLAAWKALWNYPYSDATPAHVKFILAAKAKMKRQQGDNYPRWVLDRLGTEIMVGNRIAMGRGLTPPRFRWVPYDDALLFPLNNAVMEDTPDKKYFYSREEMLLRRYLAGQKLGALPPTLAGYLSRVVGPTLEAQKAGGALAVKFEAAYLRSLDFEPASEADAAAAYAKFIGGGRPERAAYITLQDFLFRTIAAEAGRLGLAVHIHTGFGCGGYFQLGGADPILLESVLDDPALRKTTFVLLHGGPPFTKVTGMMLEIPNAYSDFSEQTWLLSGRSLAENLRYWLELFPEKIMYGTDLYPNTPQIDWEEIGWVLSRKARWALALALTGMVRDGEISRPRALQLAHMALHDNAAKLYGLQ